MEKKVIEGFEDYFITSEGFVYSTRSDPPRKLLGGLNSKGYKQYCITKMVNGAKIQTTVKPHRLVAEYFIPNPDNLRTVNHKNKDKLNNNIKNLEWMSNADNIAHGQAFIFKLIHKDGSVHITENINSFVKKLGIKGGAGNFFKLKRGTIKTCYGFKSIEQLEKIYA